MTTEPHAEEPHTSAPPQYGWASRIGRFLLYSFVAAILGTVGFSLVLSLLAAGVSTIIVWIGIPLLVAGVHTARGFVIAERNLQRTLLGHELPAPAPKQPPADAGPIRRMITPLTDPQYWLDCLWVLISFVLSLISFSLTLAWTLGAVGTIGGPIATLVVENVLPGSNSSGLPALIGVAEPYALWLDLLMQVMVGLVFLFTVGPLVRALTAMHRGIARGLLSSRYEEQQQLVRAQQSRAAGRIAESESLRRLERDLHDGPQQRLVRASIDLARVEQLSETDPDRAMQVLRETRDQLGSTLDELRRLSRGIAPPILVDRGLRAALVELAGICPIPTHVEMPEELDLPEHTEIGIYYVASEALANATKHSEAESVGVEVTRSGEDVRVRIEDDGIGGAETAAGHGLAGLAGRVASLEGRLRVHSPAAQGTVIEAVLPCRS
jgi:signal transduction histidine kinase